MDINFKAGAITHLQYQVDETWPEQHIPPPSCVIPTKKAVLITFQLYLDDCSSQHMLTPRTLSGSLIAQCPLSPPSQLLGGQVLGDQRERERE